MCTQTSSTPIVVNFAAHSGVYIKAYWAGALFFFFFCFRTWKHSLLPMAWWYQHAYCETTLVRAVELVLQGSSLVREYILVIRVCLFVITAEWRRRNPVIGSLKY